MDKYNINTDTQTHTHTITKTSVYIILPTYTYTDTPLLPSLLFHAPLTTPSSAAWACALRQVTPLVSRSVGGGGTAPNTAEVGGQQGRESAGACQRGRESALLSPLCNVVLVLQCCKSVL